MTFVKSKIKKSLFWWKHFLTFLCKYFYRIKIECHLEVDKELRLKHNPTDTLHTSPSQQNTINTEDNKTVTSTTIFTDSELTKLLKLLCTNQTFSLFCKAKDLQTEDDKILSSTNYRRLISLLGPVEAPPTPFLNDLYESVKEFKQQEYRKKGKTTFISKTDKKLYDAIEEYYEGKKIFIIPQGEDFNPRIVASIDDKQNYGYFSGVYIPQIEGKKKALVKGK